MWSFFSQQKISCESLFQESKDPSSEIFFKSETSVKEKGRLLSELRPENQQVYQYLLKQVERFQMSSHYRFSYIKPQIMEFDFKLKELDSPRASFLDFTDTVARYVALVHMQSAMTLNEIFLRKNLTLEGRENYFRMAYNKSYFEIRGLLQNLLQEMKKGPEEYQLTFLISTDNDVNQISLHRGHFESEARRILARESQNLIVHLPRPRIDQSAEDERKIEGEIFAKDILLSLQMIFRDREEYKDLKFRTAKDWQKFRQDNHQKIELLLEKLETQDFVLQENVYSILLEAFYMKAYTLGDFVATLTLPDRMIRTDFPSEGDLTESFAWLRQNLIGQKP